MATAPPYAFLAGLAVASALLAGAGLWTLTRRRSALAQRAAAAVTLALVVLALVPAPGTSGFAFLEGSLSGAARVPVDADPRAPLVVEGGTGSLDADAGVLVLTCPDGCTFRLGTNARRVPPLALSATLEGLPTPAADLQGGPLVVVDKHGTCFRSPLLLVLVVAGSSCTDCTAVPYESRTEAGGRVRLVERPPHAC